MIKNLNSLFLVFLISFLFWVFITNAFLSKIFYFLIFLYCFSFILLFFFKKEHIYLIIFWIWFFIWYLYSYFYNLNVEKNLYKLSFYFGKEAIINWQVLSLYKKYENYDSYEIKVLDINWIDNFNCKFLLRVPKNIKLNDYEFINLRWRIDDIKNFSSNFDYKKFLLSKNVYFLVNKYYDLNIKNTENIPYFRQFIIDFRQNFLERIKLMFPEKEALFLAWILIWAREDLPKDMKEDFNNSWLTHLIAVSGFNITIIIVFLWFLFWFLPLYLRFIFISLFIIFFALVVWDNRPVIRASIMWIIWYFILISWRKQHNLTLLLFTAFLMILYNPYYINYDISFHLSFLAVIWLLYFQNFFNYLFWFLPKFFAIRESFVLTMSAMSTTLPIMIFNFWKFSLFAPIANMIVWWIMPFAMFFWFLSILRDIINKKIGYFVWYITYFILKFVNEVASFFGNLKYSVILIDFWNYNTYIEIFYYMLLWFLVMYFKIRKNS